MLLFKIYLFITRGKIQENSIRTINFKIIGPTWNDEFELPGGSYSVIDIQDYIEYVIIKPETLTTIPPIHVYISRIDN